MGMSINASSGSTATQSSAWQERRQNMEALSKALQSNDLNAAKSAYAALTQNAPAGASQSNNPLAKVGQALSNGDLSGAQQAMSAMRNGRHHDRDSDDASTSSATSPAGWRSATLGNNLNAVA